MNNLLALFKRTHMDLCTKFSLFDRMVVPILLYASEVWGIYGYNDIDIIHMKFCKLLLGVRKQTVNVAVLGELGRFPLSILARERCLKYWCKIIRNNNNTVHSVYQEQCDSMLNKENSWVFKVKQAIERLGLGNLWNNRDNETNFFPVIKCRIRDQYIQEWRENINSSSKLSMFKLNFEFESYLSNIKNDTLRKTLTRFRISSHSLAIEYGRIQGIPRNERLCLCCNQNLVETEFHFIFICSKYNDIRSKYQLNYPWPNVIKFISIMKSTRRIHQLKIAKYLKESFNRRNLFIEHLNI